MPDSPQITAQSHYSPVGGNSQTVKITVQLCLITKTLTRETAVRKDSEPAASAAMELLSGLVGSSAEATFKAAGDQYPLSLVP